MKHTLCRVACLALLAGAEAVCAQPAAPGAADTAPPPGAATASMASAASSSAPPTLLKERYVGDLRHPGGHFPATVLTFKGRAQGKGVVYANYTHPMVRNGGATGRWELVGDTLCLRFPTSTQKEMCGVVSQADGLLRIGDVFIESVPD